MLLSVHFGILAHVGIKPNKRAATLAEVMEYDSHSEV